MPVYPVKPLEYGTGKVPAGCTAKLEERHRGHAILMDGIHRIPSDHSHLNCIVMPPPLPQGALQFAQFFRTRDRGLKSGVVSKDSIKSGQCIDRKNLICKT